MEKITGKSVQPGIAIGKIRVYLKKESKIEKNEITDPDGEMKRFFDARDLAVKELEEVEKQASEKIKQEDAMIFSMHQMLLQDPDFEDLVTEKIKSQSCNAEYAVTEAGKELAAMFAAMEDNDYMNQRAADFKDIAERVVSKLLNEDNQFKLTGEPVILLAEDLTPGETVTLDSSKILSFVTEHGSMNSHTAILARSLNITALVDTRLKPEPELDGKMAIVDGMNGCLYLEPDQETMNRYMEIKKEYEKKQSALLAVKGKETVTKSGKRVQLFANIGNVADAKNAVLQDAEGIGLFRSEFLYLGRNSLPTEEEQFESYKAVLTLMKGKEVIVRTMDIGADKKVSYLGLQEEENPAMGMRAIRICLERAEIFNVQLKALYRSSAYGNLSIMFPMITSEWEIDKILQRIEEIKRELKEEKVRFGEVRLGIMIETPAAAIISDILAKKVDFFSIGTNDLTQYTMAIDRQNPSVSRFLNIHHEAILRLIELTVRNAHKENVKVGICGELGADKDLTEYFLNIGIDELSVSAPKILELRDWIRNLT